MGTLVISVFASADGVVDDPTGEEGTGHGGWAMASMATPGVGEVLLRQAESTDVALFGRRMHAMFAGRWPARSGPLADRLNTMPKRVVTSSPVDPWENSAAVALDDIAELAGEVVVYGSLGLGRELLRRGQVDEVRLLVCPVLLGAGARLTDGAGDRQCLQLRPIRDVGGDVTFLRYGVTTGC